MGASLLSRGLVAVIAAVILAGPLEAAGEKLTWRSRQVLPTNRFYLGAAAAPTGTIYAIGGQADGTTRLRTNEEFNPATNTWRRRADMPTPRGSLGVAAAGGKIYAIGGQTPTVTTVVEEYDPTSDTWATKSPLREEKYGIGAAGANGKIYVAGGGRHHTSALTEVDEYDPATNTWTARAPMKTGRQYPALAAATNGKLYAIGGMQVNEAIQIIPLTTVEEYDPATNTWTDKAPLPQARWNLGAVGALNGKVYVLGGDRSSSTVYEYDPAANTWVQATSMQAPHIDSAAAIAPNGNIYAVGGTLGQPGPFFSTVEEGIFEVPTPTVTPTPTRTATPTQTPTVTPTYSPTPPGTPAVFVFLPLLARGMTIGW